MHFSPIKFAALVAFFGLIGYSASYDVYAADPTESNLKTAAHIDEALKNPATLEQNIAQWEKKVIYMYPCLSSYQDVLHDKYVSAMQVRFADKTITQRSTQLILYYFTNEDLQAVDNSLTQGRSIPSSLKPKFVQVNHQLFKDYPIEDYKFVAQTFVPAINEKKCTRADLDHPKCQCCCSSY